MPPFLYFDLGNVVLNFDHRRACRQMADVSGAPYDQIWSLVFEGELGTRYDRGDITCREFHAEFCRATASAPDFAALLHAASDMFSLNTALVPLLTALRRAGYRLGLLSNTCLAHWNFVASGRFAVVPAYFDCLALSFELRAAKPAAKIYQAAAERAGRAPHEIFFVDDLPANVAGARAAGFDAVVFQSAAQLLRDLAERGFRLPL